MTKPNGYKDEEFIHYIQKKNGSKFTVGVNTESERLLPEKELYEISFEQIEKINLNKIGNEIPYAFNNVINLERYMLYYWKHMMDSDCILLYLHLWEYCDKREGVDICYPKMKELQDKMGLSKPTLISKIKKLEEHNFLVQIHRLNRNNGNRETSPIFKLRQTIPLLSNEHYKKLNPYMQNKHDEYMEKFANESKMDMFSQNGSDTIEGIIENHGDRIVTSKARHEIQKLLEKDQEENYIMAHLPLEKKETLVSSKEFQKELQEVGFSRPTSETLFRDCFALYDEQSYTAHIIAPDEIGKEFLETGLSDFHKEKLNEALINMYFNVYQMKSFTAKQYIINILKGN